MAIRHGLAGVAAAVSLIGATPAFCADPAPSAHNMELARHLIVGMHMDQLMQGMMRQMAPAMVAQARRSNPNLTDDQAKVLTDAVAEASIAMMAKMTDRMIPLYASTFTEQELQDVVNFYDTSSGQAMLTKMPVLMGKVAPMMTEIMPDMMADVNQRVCAKIDCSKRAATPKT